MILCPTRGGEASRINQEKVIEIASERGCPILFLYISNINFLHKFGSPMQLKRIQSDLDEMGEFFLTIAQERAEEKGVKAEILLKHGVFSEVLQETIEEKNIGTLFLGSAVGDKGYTNQSYMQNLIEHLQAETGVEVILVREGEIILHESSKSCQSE
jgi:hypothetical protein